MSTSPVSRPLVAERPVRRSVLPIPHLTIWDAFGSVVALSSVAVSQPVLELIGANPEFLLAHAVTGWSALLVACVVVGVPVALGTFALVARRLHEPSGTAVQLVVMTIPAVVAFVQVVERFGASGAWTAVSVALVLALAMLALYLRSAATRAAFRLVGLMAPLVVLALFVFATDASAVILPASPQDAPETVEVENPVPLVVIVFDELPVASLMDPSGQIQQQLYPNFARLAGDSVWYRNAFTVESNTERAIPSILTGAPSVSGNLPISSHYRDTLFALLVNEYEISSFEPLTDLCPPNVCRSDPSSRSSSWELILTDLFWVALHLILPEEWTEDLPPINETWSNFGGTPAPSPRLGEETESDFDLADRFDETLESGRLQMFERFLTGLSRSTGSGPEFHFLHLLLPHSPWEYLPDGTVHGAPVPPAGKVGQGWGPDDWLVSQAYQQHILQLQFADRLLGETMDRMADLEIYEESMVVVLADHGIVFRPNVDRRRALSADNLGEIAAVPLFIKYPESQLVGVDDFRAELTDIVPTVADVLGVGITWPVTGSSLLAPDRPVRTETEINGGSVVAGVDGREKYEIADRRFEAFESGDPFGLAPAGTTILLGARLDELVIGSQVGSLRVALGELEAPIASVERSGAYLWGTITVGGSGDGTDLLAVVVAGRVVAITRTYIEDDVERFQAMLPPTPLSGPGDIEMFLIRRVDSDFELAPIPSG